MTDGLSERDVDALGRLGRVSRVVDPVPAFVNELARTAILFRDVDAELMVLREPVGSAAVRGPALDELVLDFGSDGVGLQLQVFREDETVSVMGRMSVPAAGWTVSTVSVGGRQIPAVVDEFGRFVVAGLPIEPIRVRCERPGQRSVVTPWITIPPIA